MYIYAIYMYIYPGEVFIVYIFMTTECVSVGIVGVELYSPVEESETVFVFLLETETVANSNPTFLSINAFVK